jgi:hypothetical protein
MLYSYKLHDAHFRVSARVGVVSFDESVVIVAASRLMSEHSLDPPLEMDTLPIHPPSTGKSFTSHKLARSDYAVGICLLLLVVFLWTASNFVTQV